MRQLNIINDLFQTVTVPSSQKVKEGQTYIEYHEDDVQDSVLEAVLHLAYRMFKVSVLQAAFHLQYRIFKVKTSVYI